MQARALAVVLVLGWILPLASATDAECQAATDGGATPVGPLYLGSSGGVWRESNNRPGLQTADCTTDDGRDVHRDERIA